MTGMVVLMTKKNNWNDSNGSLNNKLLTRNIKTGNCDTVY
jgi:hypothetical protein